MVLYYHGRSVVVKRALKKDKVSFNKLFLIFFIGCVLGWIFEEIFYYVTEGVIENRGFLYGPYLPVYGLGAILIYLFLNRFKKWPLLVFLLSFIITGVVEYLTGLWMLRVYNRRWWDYTGLFLNIDGFVCFRSVFTFGIGALCLIYWFVPLIDKLINKLRKKTVFVLIVVIGVIMVTDLVLTIIFRY